MKNLMTMFLCSCVAASQTLMAASQLTEIKIEDDIVYFTTKEILTTTVTCVLTENIGRWAFTLRSTNGKGIHLALMTAATSGQKISVTSANDCHDKNGFERPLSVSVFNH
ncbi:hypothetical protein CJF42_15120 [Pseudoalteromonas sp. NBT06-2]|uniref:hypothetical protein n=1 Tax=Pseudoalteromonas sp. NBT06-2 TaxID=2025950 RepID=UPI000BA6019C|nr:hypothetical protein [Pseudoalteromonas sp. NBT06-2]PAJ73592.1 hypothetical protein CJF42_15120 [Pseudoalteromonas sp. NBT06-2]